MQNKKKHSACFNAKVYMTSSSKASVCPPSGFSHNNQSVEIQSNSGSALMVAETLEERSVSLKEYQKMRDQFRELLGYK